MSRSYKKNPVVTQSSGSSCTKVYKQQSNKIVRNTIDNNIDNEIVPQNSSYKKLYPSWNICDYKFRFTEDEAREDYKNTTDPYFRKRFPTEQSFMNWWKKHYIGK